MFKIHRLAHIFWLHNILFEFIYVCAMHLSHSFRVFFFLRNPIRLDSYWKIYCPEVMHIERGSMWNVREWLIDIRMFHIFHHFSFTFQRLNVPLRSLPSFHLLLLCSYYYFCLIFLYEFCDSKRRKKSNSNEIKSWKNGNFSLELINNFQINWNVHGLRYSFYESVMRASIFCCRWCMK